MNSTITSGYKKINSINLGTQFVREHELVPGKRYVMTIEGLPGIEAKGTLQPTGIIGGLAPLYSAFPDLQPNDTVELQYLDEIIHITVPGKTSRFHTEEGRIVPAEGDWKTRYVFERKSLRHIHITQFAPGNIQRWTPENEPDVYIAFGTLAELTRYRYCCSTSKALLTRLGFTSDTKPDAILIDATTQQYLVAEFKMRSSDFTSNHNRGDIDVLVCWIDDIPGTDVDRRNQLPPEVLALQPFLDEAIKQGNVDL